MIIPLSHENLRGRRWPVITIAIIVLNTAIFLYTNGRMEPEMARTYEVEVKILLLSAHFPDAQMTPVASDVVSAFKLQNPEAYRKLISESQAEEDDASSDDQQTDHMSAADANAEMASLCS